MGTSMMGLMVWLRSLPGPSAAKIKDRFLRERLRRGIDDANRLSYTSEPFISQHVRSVLQATIRLCSLVGRQYPDLSAAELMGELVVMRDRELQLIAEEMMQAERHGRQDSHAAAEVDVATQRSHQLDLSAMAHALLELHSQWDIAGHSVN